MSNISIRSAVFLAVYTLASSVYGDLYFDEVSYQISGDVIDNAMSKNIDGTDSENSLDDIRVSTVLDGTIGGATGTAYTFAHAGHGALGVEDESRISEFIRAPSSGGGGQLTDFSTARFGDFLTIIAGPPGTPGIVHSLLHLTGSVSAISIGYIPPIAGNHDYVDASATASLSISGTGIPIHGPYPTLGNSTYAYAQDILTRDIGHEIFNQDNAPATIPVDEPFVSGIPFQVTYAMTASSDAVLVDGDSTNKETGVADSSARFSDTLAWGGITSITDSNGVPLTGWTVTSASGFDYSKPAVDTPEPSTLVLLGLAAVSLTAATRKRT
jgi:hypothetical protein